MTYEEILTHVEPVYSTLRKPNGQLYTSEVERSLKGALSANGLFDMIERKVFNPASARKAGVRRKRSKVEQRWHLSHQKADDYLKQEMVKFVSHLHSHCLGSNQRQT
jgi:hypothetical protein